MALVRSQNFTLLLASMPCWSCPHRTMVGAIAAPAGSTAWDAEADDEEVWECLDNPVALTGVRKLSPEIQSELEQLLPSFRFDHSNTTQLTYLMNHCISCGVKIGDHYTHSEAGSPFFAWPRNSSDIVETAELGGGEVVSVMPYA